MQYEPEDLVPVICENKHTFAIMYGEVAEEHPCPFCGAKVELDDDY